MSKLFIIATPIGNLSDITARAITTLKGVDLILCEDTRQTQKLLNHFSIKTSTLSYHQHSKLNKVEKIINLLKQGKDLALVSDAGTPGIADPGGKLVEQVIKELGEQVAVVPIPGSSALTAAASISGFPMDKFLFLGFPPAKKKRQKFFQEVIQSKHPVILYESPHRILKTLNELSEISTYQHVEISLVVGRELTKKFETIYRGIPAEVAKNIESDKVKGEFVIVVALRVD